MLLIDWTSFLPEHDYWKCTHTPGFNTPLYCYSTSGATQNFSMGGGGRLNLRLYII